MILNKLDILKLFIPIILLSSLLIVAFAIGLQDVTLETSLKSGEVNISMKDGENIFGEKAKNIQPGDRISGNFEVANIGSADCYFDIYLENVNGVLADVLIFRVYDEQDNLLKEIKPYEFTIENSVSSKSILQPKESEYYTIEAYFPKQLENEYQDKSLTFDIVASAIQSKNNEGNDEK